MDVEMDRRHIENDHLGQSHHDHGDGSLRTPSPIPSLFIKDKVMYRSNPVDGIMKLQSFCETARNKSYR